VTPSQSPKPGESDPTSTRDFNTPPIQIFETPKRGLAVFAIVSIVFVGLGIVFAGSLGHSDSSRFEIRAVLGIYIGLFAFIGVVSHYIRRFSRNRKMRGLPEGQYYAGEAMSRPLLVSQGPLKDRGDFVISDRGISFAAHRSELIPAYTVGWSDISHITFLGRRLVLTLPDGTGHEYQVFDTKIVTDTLKSLANGTR
jgi:hypothetical protein